MQLALSFIAITITVFAYLPYIQSIRDGRTKPHIFSWIIWGSATVVVSFAQLAAKGGVGAWPITISGLLTIYTAWLAWQKKGDIDITPLDWFFFITALSALPLWYLTANPLWAVIILTTVDLLGFAPTFRKSWFRPQDESLTFFMLMTLRNFIAAAALEHYALATLLFPMATGAAGALFIVMVILRRNRLEH